MRTSKNIILCPDCGGNGFSVCKILTDHHKREYDWSKISCDFCKGKGRVFELISMEAFNDEN